MEKILILFNPKFPFCKFYFHNLLKENGFKIKANDKGSITLADDTLISFKAYNKNRKSDLLRTKYNIKDRTVFVHQLPKDKDKIKEYLSQDIYDLVSLSNLLVYLKSVRNNKDKKNPWYLDKINYDIKEINILTEVDNQYVFETKEDAEKALKILITNKINSNNKTISSLKRQNITLQKRCIEYGLKKDLK